MNFIYLVSQRSLYGGNLDQIAINLSQRVKVTKNLAFKSAKQRKDKNYWLQKF